MDEGLTIKGDLRESGLPELLKSFLKNREGGILTLRRGDVAKSLYFKEGRIVWASSSDPDDRLGECLLREGKLTVEQLQESAQHIRPGRKQGTILIELGYITPDDLVRGVILQVEEIITSLFGWTFGEYEMVLQDVDTHEFMSLNLATEGLIFQAAGRVRSWWRFYRGMGSMETVLAHADGAEMMIYKIDLTEDESHIWSLANGKLSVSQICAMSYTTNFETCRTLWALIVIGALQVVTAKDAETAFREQVAEYETMELREEIERGNRILAAVAERLRGRLDALLPSFLGSSLAKVEELYPAAFRGTVFGAEGTLEADLIVSNIRASETDDPRGVWREAFNELVYAILMQARVRFGKEEERALSDIVEALRSEGTGEDA